MAEKTSGEKPAWAKQEPKEVEAKIIELAQKGFSSEKIGLVLRDAGIPASKIIGRRISAVLKENNLPADSYSNIKSNIENMRKHLLKNPQDKNTKRILNEQVSRLNRIERKIK